VATSLRLILTSPTASFTFSTELSSFKIGRSSKCEFNIPKEDLSREHCLFESTEEGYFITDLESSNGVVVNRDPIAPNVRTKVTLESSIVLSNIYELKINRFDVSVKATEKTALIENDEATTTFKLDFQKEVQKKDYETLKMIVGFLVIIGFVVYQALGR
jgi:pSer/pThr/pTyr-binding forkhead associated (FHA) protein